MKLALYVLLLCVAAIFAEETELEHGEREKRSAPSVASTAERYVGSTEWSKSGCKHGQCGQWKCNYFVADMLIEAGKSYPKRSRWRYSPIGANEWLSPNSRYIDSNCWRVTSYPNRGDIAASGGHVGIVTRYGETVSATEYNVVRNDWGFRSGQSTVFWEHTC